MNFKSRLSINTRTILVAASLSLPTLVVSTGCSGNSGYKSNVSTALDEGREATTDVRARDAKGTAIKIKQALENGGQGTDQSSAQNAAKGTITVFEQVPESPWKYDIYTKYHGQSCEVIFQKPKKTLVVQSAPIFNILMLGKSGKLEPIVTPVNNWYKLQDAAGGGQRLILSDRSVGRRNAQTSLDINSRLEVVSATYSYLPTDDERKNSNSQKVIDLFSCVFESPIAIAR